jgi:uncharacterized protein YodC (DUF2158 family)
MDCCGFIFPDCIDVVFSPPVNAQRFIRGDVVQLKSGGKTMTVDQVLNGRVRACYWDEREKRFDVADVPMAMLQLYEINDDEDDDEDR